MKWVLGYKQAITLGASKESNNRLRELTLQEGSEGSQFSQVSQIRLAFFRNRLKVTSKAIAGCSVGGCHQVETQKIEKTKELMELELARSKLTHTAAAQPKESNFEHSENFELWSRQERKQTKNIKKKNHFN